MEDQHVGATNAVIAKYGATSTSSSPLTVQTPTGLDTSRAIVEKYGRSETCKLGNFITVEKVKYFTKVTQMRLGWDDAHATHEDMSNAVKKEDYNELIAIMPTAARLIERG